VTLGLLWGARLHAALTDRCLDPKSLVRKLLDAIDPDTIDREAAARRVTPEAAAEVLKEEACRPFDDPREWQRISPTRHCRA
jgi:hypothetical protein